MEMSIWIPISITLVLYGIYVVKNYMQPRKFKIQKFGDGTYELIMKSRWHGIYWPDLYAHKETGNITAFHDDFAYDYRRCKGDMVKIEDILNNYSDYIKSNTLVGVILVRYVIDEPIIISTIESTPVPVKNNRELDIIESFVRSRSDAYREKRRTEHEILMAKNIVDLRGPVNSAYIHYARDLGPK